ncbi:MAG TPA: GvpL/GvpF family gas vesicle protein [Stellaceae bacterium]|nr:GvpL/GvpF family gas vesicle protein [Stellaceae bacterium]
MAPPDQLGSVDLPLGIAPGDPLPGEQAVYLFALVDGAAADGELALSTGGESDPFSRPLLHRAGPIAALISMVPFADYCGADAARHLGDLPWLAPRTMYHAAVLRQAMQSSPVYPVPFATLFASATV